MNEPVIHDSVPASSPILAYGESPRTGKRRLLLGAVFLLPIVAIFAFSLWAFFGSALPVPSAPLTIAILRPSDPLPADAPAVWADAKQKAAPFPVIIGNALTDSGVKPFAIGLRTFSSGCAVKRGIWQLISDACMNGADTTRLSTLIPWPWMLPYLRIWPNRFLGNDPAAGTPATVGGRVRGSRWETDAVVPKTTDRTAVIGDTWLNLSALPGAWPAIEAALESDNFSMTLPEIPTAVGWSRSASGTLSIAMTFAEAPSPSTKEAIAAGLGLFDTSNHPLSDGSGIIELLPPHTLLSATSSASWITPDGRTLTFDNALVHIASAQNEPSERPLPAACRGHVLAAFSPPETDTLFRMIGVPIPTPPRQIIWLEESGKLTACWE